MLYVDCVLIVLAVVAGLLLALEEIRPMVASTSPEVSPDVGWVYFLSPVGGEEEEPPAPVKIGRTSLNPWEDSLPEVEAMLPKQIEVVEAVYSPNALLLEKLALIQLKQYKQRGSWFDRDAALAWVDEIRSEFG